MIKIISPSNHLESGKADRGSLKSVRNRKAVGELVFSVLIAERLRAQGPTQGRWKLWVSEEEEKNNGRWTGERHREDKRRI